MKIMSRTNGNILGEVVTNHSLTLDEALDLLGCKVDEDGCVVCGTDIYDWEDLEMVDGEIYNGEEVAIASTTPCWLDLAEDRFTLRTTDKLDVISSTYEEAGIDTAAEGCYDDYDRYFKAVMGFVPDYTVG